MDNLPLEKPVPSLEPVAMAALDAGRILMEAGASASSVQAIVGTVARGLGAERLDLRIGYASLAVTIGVGRSSITRMSNVGRIGVNQRLNQRVSHLAKRVSGGELTTEETRAELSRLAAETPRHPSWVTAPAVGVACAAFGRLLGADWYSTGPIFLAATTGEYIRGALLRHHVNIFIVTTLISFLSSAFGGFGAHWTRSETVTTAMIASVLLLVPGIPAVNAQNDVLDGHPTLGSARAVTVVMTLIFLAVGLWFGRVLVSRLP